MSGIGWGASLYGWDLALVSLMFLGAPYALGLGVVLAILSLLPRRHHWLALMTAFFGLLIPWGLVLAVAATARR